MNAPFASTVRTLARSRPALVAGLFVAGLALAPLAAIASGGGGGGGGGGAGGGSGGHAAGAAGGAASGGMGSGGKSTDLTTCEQGQVWDSKHQKCIGKQSGVLPDSDLTEYAYALAKAGRYQEAIDVLDTLHNPDTARALNYRGYATRKLGRTEEGIRYYLQSVALDPTYTQVREYLGEAYVTLGKFDLAQDQLATIQKLCGSTECEEYQDLSVAIGQAAHL